MASSSEVKQETPLAASRSTPEPQPGTEQHTGPGGRRASRRSSGRLERRERFLWPGQCGDVQQEQAIKHKMSMSHEKGAGWRRTSHNLQEEGTLLRNHDDHSQGALSDSENEEPVMKRTRNVSAFVRKPKRAQRSHSCTGVEGGAKAGLLPHQPLIDTHTLGGGVLLSSENSRPSTAPGPRRGPMTSPAPRERSVSPESNDSISGELTHFKPIVCCPRTPPKRLPDGRLLRPPLVKTTPRSLWGRVASATARAPAVPAVTGQAPAVATGTGQDGGAGRVGPKIVTRCRGGPRGRRRRQVAVETGRLHRSRPERYFLRSWAGHNTRRARHACHTAL